jgi:hypothetical protein
VRTDVTPDTRCDFTLLKPLQENLGSDVRNRCEVQQTVGVKVPNHQCKLFQAFVKRQVWQSSERGPISKHSRITNHSFSTRAPLTTSHSMNAISPSTAG